MNWLRRRPKEFDKELEEFRSIMDVPSHFEEGFSLSSFLGTLFVALVMVPGALYMELVAGMGIGGAASWVTVILFVEVAKRANAKLSRAQLFILFYMTGIVVGQSVFRTPLFTQYLVRSEAAIAQGISDKIPYWVAPPDVADLPPTFLQSPWMPAVGLMLFTAIFGQFNNMVLGYGLFRVTSDIERLPFPLAPVAAQGVVAIADQVEGAVKSAGSNVRWRMFCVGAGIGMVFGLIYMALPTITGAMFGQPITVFPIPFADFCRYTNRYLPAVATGISFDLGQFIFGMIMPFYAMVGAFIGELMRVVGNPVLHHFGYITTWKPGDETVTTLFNNKVDFYFSFTIGVSLAIAGYGVLTIIRSLRKRKAEKAVVVPIPKERGDIPSKFIIWTYFFSVMIYIIVSGFLIEWHKGVMIVLLFFGFIYTPIISYVTAKLQGLVGGAIEIPFIQQLAFIFSGYKGVKVWFLPIPKANYGVLTMFYKQAELLGCKFGSIWKSTVILFPIIFIALICFSSFIWSLGEIPSQIYPYTDKMWDFHAKNACLVYSATLSEYSQFREAISLGKIFAGLGFGTICVSVLSWFAAPTMLFFGIARGVMQQTLPHTMVPGFIGALVGKFYFEKKLGREWRKMIPVVGAGFFVGVGLLIMLSIGFVFLGKAVTTVVY